MTEAKKGVYRNLLLMQLRGGSITQQEYDQKMSEIPIAAEPFIYTPIADGSVKPQVHSDVIESPKPNNVNSTYTEAIDQEKARLSNLLHTISPNKSAKHITDQILSLRLKRKEAYSQDRQTFAKDTSEPMPPIAPAQKQMTFREVDNLRVKIGRWEKKLLLEPDNFELKEKLADAKIKYQSFRT